MSNEAKPLTKFRISEDDLRTDKPIGEAYDAYCLKRSEFGGALRALNEATKELHDLLEVPFRSNGLIPEGRDWTFKEADLDDGLNIFVWAEPKHRGRRKPEVPTQRLSLVGKNFRYG